MRVFTYDSAAMSHAHPTEPAAPTIDLAPYAGRWIALVRDRVTGSGLTPRAALLQAKATRPKDEPLIVFVPADIKSYREHL